MSVLIQNALYTCSSICENLCRMNFWTNDKKFESFNRDLNMFAYFFCHLKTLKIEGKLFALLNIQYRIGWKNM